VSLPDVLDRDVLGGLLASIDLVPQDDPRPIGTGYGFAGICASVVLATPSGSRDAVVKVWDPKAFGLAEFEFYGEWAGRLPIRLPECLGMHATEDVAALVLERIEVIRQGDAETFALDEDLAALAEIPALAHRATVGTTTDLPDHAALRPRPSEFHDARRVAYAAAFGLPEGQPVRSIVIASEQADRLAAEMLSSAHSGLLHGDVHLDNVVTDISGPVLLDWSRLSWGPAAIDLAGLLVTSVPTDHYEATIATYRDTTEVSDEALTGGLLHQVMAGTLGVAAWQPTTRRQARVHKIGVAKALAAAEWLFEWRRELVPVLS
jgi:fructosamine-3-kinase